MIKDFSFSKFLNYFLEDFLKKSIPFKLSSRLFFDYFSTPKRFHTFSSSRH